MTSMKQRLKVFFDGGCRPNPGPIEAAVVIRGQTHFFDDLGPGSSTDAEWSALFCAVRLSLGLGVPHVILMGDSIEVMRQASAVVATAMAGSAHGETLLSLLRPGTALSVRWIKREQNLAGIALEARHRR